VVVVVVLLVLVLVLVLVVVEVSSRMQPQWSQVALPIASRMSAQVWKLPFKMRVVQETVKPGMLSPHARRVS